MNISEFISENYIWILVVVVLTIVTVIGFLVDKKRSGNKKESNKDVTNLTSDVNNGIPVNNDGNLMNNNMMMNNSNLMNNNSSAVQPPVFTPQTTMDINNNPNNNMMNNFGMNTINNSVPKPVENVTPVVSPEQMYQPLSEQKPTFLPNNNGMDNSQMMGGMNSQVVAPNPVMPQSINQVPVMANNGQNGMNNNMFNNGNANFNYGNQGNVPNYNNQMNNNSLPNNMVNSNPVNNGMNFVYGPQNNQK